MLNVALPKGRLGEKVYAMFASAGFDCPEVLMESRKLVFENEEAGVRYFWVKPSDVSVYVERGAADIASVSRDHCPVLPPCHPSHGSAGTGVSAGEKRRARL